MYVSGDDYPLGEAIVFALLMLSALIPAVLGFGQKKGGQDDGGNDKDA